MWVSSSGESQEGHLLKREIAMAVQRFVKARARDYYECRRWPPSCLPMDWRESSFVVAEVSAFFTPLRVRYLCFIADFPSRVTSGAVIRVCLQGTCWLSIILNLRKLLSHNPWG